MKTPTVGLFTCFLATLAHIAAGSPVPELIEAREPLNDTLALEKRASWSVTPYAGSCSGASTGWAGTTSRGCTNFPFQASNVIVISGSCIVTVWHNGGCPAGAPRTGYGPGSSACYPFGSSGANSFSVTC